jgi:hypothetical protein
MCIFACTNDVNCVYLRGCAFFSFVCVLMNQVYAHCGWCKAIVACEVAPRAFFECVLMKKTYAHSCCFEAMHVYA